MDVVSNRQPLVCGGLGVVSSDIPLEPIFGVLYFVWSILVVIIGIDIKVDDVIAKISHGLRATRC